MNKDQPEVNANLDMKNHFIRNVENPDLDNDAASKRYVDMKANLRARKRDLEFYLALDGSEKMTGNLDMNDNQIKKLKLPTETTDAANKQYVDAGFQQNLLTWNNSKKQIDTKIDSVSKKVDSVSKRIMQPSHTLKNVFQVIYQT